MTILSIHKYIFPVPIAGFETHCPPIKYGTDNEIKATIATWRIQKNHITNLLIGLREYL